MTVSTTDTGAALVLQLVHPVSVGGRRVERLRFRRSIRGKDVRRCRSAGGLPMLLELAAILCGQPLRVIDRLAHEVDHRADVLALALERLGIVERQRAGEPAENSGD